MKATAVLRSIGWWMLYLAFVAYVGTLIYEMTYWTWLRGPQMVGFSLVHRGLKIPGIIAAVCAYLLAIFSLGMIVRNIVKKIQTKRSFYLHTIVLLGTVALSLIPYSFWMWLTISIAGPGNEPGEMLRYSAAVGNEKVVKLLLNEGINADIPDEWGKTPLSAAAVGGKPKIVKFLLEKGADVNVKGALLGRTPIMDAASGGNTEVVRILLENGADPYLEDNDGRTARELAKDEEIVQILSQAMRQ